MIIKATFKSHFKIKKNFKKNLNKFTFVKNIVVFFLFFKVFFKNLKISLSFSKKKRFQTSLLKAPSRHKKFFHQICFEYFTLKAFFYFLINPTIGLNNVVCFFQKLNTIFERFGSNVLLKSKFSTLFSINVGNFFKIC